MLTEIVQKIKANLKLKTNSQLNKYLDIDGWLTHVEAYGLYHIASLLPPNPIVVEIGSWKGKSTWCICQGLKKGTVNCIDPFNADGEEGSKELYEKIRGPISLLAQFKANLANVPKEVTVNAYPGYSSDFVNHFKTIDLLFIDGDHSIEGCRFDFEHFSKDIRPGGYLLFHDFYPDKPDFGPTWVIRKLVINNPGYFLRYRYDSLAVFEKI